MPDPHRWSVVIPSRNRDNLSACIDQLKIVHPDILDDQIIIVSDGLSPSVRDEFSGSRWVEGIRPFVFARAVNSGVAAAGSDDVLIVGDDVRLQSRGMIDRLQRLAGAGVSAVAPEVDGNCGQESQRVGQIFQYPPWIAFICVFIRRESWDAVGPLDEQFVGYGYDDVDWCVRAMAIAPVLVDHGSSVLHTEFSTFRSTHNWRDLYKQNREMFEGKWSSMGVA